MLAYLQERGIAAFTVDVVSNDSYIGSPQRLEQRTLGQIEKQNGGIVLFHDIKASTAKALPNILAELKKRGYKIVHLRPKTTFTPLPALTAELEAQARQGRGQGRRQAEAGAVLCSRSRPRRSTAVSAPEVTELAPAPRERTHEGGTHATASEPVAERRYCRIAAAAPDAQAPCTPQGHRRRGVRLRPQPLQERERQILAAARLAEPEQRHSDESRTGTPAGATPPRRAHCYCS